MVVCLVDDFQIDDEHDCCIHHRAINPEIPILSLIADNNAVFPVETEQEQEESIENCFCDILEEHFCAEASILQSNLVQTWVTQKSLKSVLHIVYCKPHDGYHCEN